MTKTRNCLSALCLIAVSTAACAAPSAPNDAPPPYAGDVKVEKPAPRSGPAARKPSAEEANPLLPSKADMEKAREERAHGHLPPKFDRQTKIEEVRDENNRVTEYVVTPGTTQIPYRIENRAERPIDSSPAGNSRVRSARPSSSNSAGNRIPLWHKHSITPTACVGSARASAPSGTGRSGSSASSSSTSS
ncbi:MAG: hypothetical protein ACLUNV_11940 [Sutterella wadsworthensis]